MDALIAALALLVIVVFAVNEFYQARLGVPCMPTMPRVRRKMLELAAPPGDSIVELGSGWGGMAISAARAFPGTRVTGLERSVFPYLFSRLRRLLAPGLENLSFRREDFFSYPLHDASTVLCYLTNPLMAKLKDKLWQELPPGAKIVSSTFFIPGREPERTEDVRGLWTTRIFVYRKKA